MNFLPLKRGIIRGRGLSRRVGGLTEDLRVIDLTKAKSKALVASGIL